jgi:hypothetical protein
MDARADVDIWQKGASSLLNNSQLIEGGVDRRAGMSYLKDISSEVPATTIKMRTFRFNNDQEYICVFHDGVSGAPWTTAQLDDIRTAQQLDTMIVVHPDFAMQKIVRVSGNAFVLSQFTFDQNTEGSEAFQPYFRFQDPNIFLTPTDGVVLLNVSKVELAWANHVADGSTLEWGDAVLNRKHLGGRFFAFVGGTLLSTSIETITHTADIVGAVCRIYETDYSVSITVNAGSPTTRVGSDSDPVNVTGVGVHTFTWSTGAPVLEAGKTYWAIFSDPTSTGNTIVRLVADQGARFGFGSHDTISSMTSTQQPTDLKMSVLVDEADVDEQHQGHGHLANSTSSPWGDAAGANLKHAGIHWPADVSMTVLEATIYVQAVAAAMTSGHCSIWTKDATTGNPDTQVGGDSDTFSISTATGPVFATWSSSFPVLSAGTTYWIIFSDDTTAGSVTVAHSTADTDATHGFDYADLIADVGDTVTTSSNIVGGLRGTVAGPTFADAEPLQGDSASVTATLEDVTSPPIAEIVATETLSTFATAPESTVFGTLTDLRMLIDEIGEERTLMTSTIGNTFTADDEGEVWRLQYEIVNVGNDVLSLENFEFTIEQVLDGFNAVVIMRRTLPEYQDLTGAADSNAEFERRIYETMPWFDPASPPAATDVVPTDLWQEPVFTTRRGFARSVTFHNNRLAFGGSKDLRSNFWLSVIGQFFNFDTGDAEDDRSVQNSLGANLAHTIKHMVSHNQLLFFTDLGEFFIPESAARPLTPLSGTAKQQSAFGSSNVIPLVFDEAVIFVTGAQHPGDVENTVRELVFADEGSPYEGRALNLPSTELFTDIIDLGVMQKVRDRPEAYLVFLNADGTFAVFHGNRVENVAGVVPWSTRAGDTPRAVSGFGDNLYIVTERDINSVTVQYLEELNPDFVVDAAVIPAGSGTSWTAAGLAGETFEVVKVAGDEWVEQVTANGSGVFTTTSSFSAGELQCGFDFTREIKTLPLDIALPQGNDAGGLKRVIYAYARMVQKLVETSVATRTITLGNKDTTAGLDHTKASWLRFGCKGWDRDSVVELVQGKPVKLRVLGLNIEVKV